MSIYKVLPNEIVYHCIIPYIPCFDLTRSILRLQKKKIHLIKYLKKILPGIDISVMKNHILKSYLGELDFFYENDFIYLYCNLRKLNDYVCILR
jgi:hypothetical protein